MIMYMNETTASIKYHGRRDAEVEHTASATASVGEVLELELQGGLDQLGL